MANRRMITSDLFEDEIIGGLPVNDRLLWVGLITIADDQGRTADNPALIRSKIFPYDDIAVQSIDDGLTHLAEANRITRYQTAGKKCIQINNWWKHQRTQWAGKSNLPAPEGWTDKARYNSSTGIQLYNWNTEGGYCTNNPSAPVDGGVDGGVDDAPALTEVKLSKDKYKDKSLSKDKLSGAGAVFTVYENNIGILTPIVSEHIKEAIEEFPPDWIESAIQVAVNNNVRKWSYIRAVLDRWQVEGFKSIGKSPKDKDESIVTAGYRNPSLDVIERFQS